MTSIAHTKKAGPDGKIVVGVADFAVTSGTEGSLITYALGSCIGVTIYDPVANVGGLLHFMLPSSKTNPEKAAANPAMFGDTGIPAMFKAAYDLGAEKSRLIVCAAGGAEIMENENHFKVGTRNRTLLRKIFWKNNILLSADETGGTTSRTIDLQLADGRIAVRSKGEERVLWPL